MWCRVIMGGGIMGGGIMGRDNMGCVFGCYGCGNYSKLVKFRVILK